MPDSLARHFGSFMGNVIGTKKYEGKKIYGKKSLHEGLGSIVLATRF